MIYKGAGGKSGVGLGVGARAGLYILLIGLTADFIYRRCDSLIQEPGFSILWIRSLRGDYYSLVNAPRNSGCGARLFSVFPVGACVGVWGRRWLPLNVALAIARLRLENVDCCNM